MSYQSTKLWQKSFGPSAFAANAAERDFFATALSRFHDAAEQLVSQIPVDLKDFTVHDITHLDALWETANTICGDDYPPLNPAEAFVLGGAILMHDAGMCLAAYPKGIVSLRATIEWKDALGRQYRNTSQEVPLHPPYDQVLQKSADLDALRILHAKQAQELPTISWNGSYLIQDEDLRGHYGHLIGNIARSHWNSPHTLLNEFDIQFPAVAIRSQEFKIPNTWTIDPLKLALILRTSDAAHLDARRAPTLLKNFIKPTGVSADHWRFQNKLGQPWAEDQTLFFRSNQPFSVDESDAWWLCFDAIQMVDEELRAADSILQTHSKQNRNRFFCKKVSRADRSEDLARLIEHFATYLEGVFVLPAFATSSAESKGRAVSHLAQLLKTKWKNISIHEQDITIGSVKGTDIIRIAHVLRRIKK